MITIIDYGLGNLGSITNVLNKLEIKSRISTRPSELDKATILILPGVGAAGKGMINLKKISLDKEIIKQVKKDKPLLGICLGMQLLFDYSQEGSVACLGLLKGKVKKFKMKRKVPQIGWNEIRIKNKESRIKKIFINIPNNSYFYFVNSYYCKPEDESIVVATSEYGEKFASIVIKNNIVATQFHPEKSGMIGYKLLKNIFIYFENFYSKQYNNLAI